MNKMGEEPFFGGGLLFHINSCLNSEKKVNEDIYESNKTSSNHRNIKSDIYSQHSKDPVDDDQEENNKQKLLVR